MNYKKWLIEDLKDLNRCRFAIEQQTKELATLEAEYASIKATSFDKMPSGSGDNLQEEKLLTVIAKKEELATCLEATKLHVEDMERLLERLPKDERTIIEKCFVNDAKSTHEELAEELHYSSRTVNRKKQDALNHMTRMRFGAGYRP